MDASTTIRRHELTALADSPAGDAAATRSRSRRSIPELSDLILACRHRLMLTALMSGLVATALAATAWILVNPRYEANSQVRVREQGNTIFSPQTTRADDLAFFRSQGKLAQSTPVLTAALADESILSIAGALPRGNQTEWLKGLLTVRTESGTEVMDLTVQHPSPDVAHTLCNAVTRAYLTEITQRLAFDREQRERELERAARAADEQLDELWDTLNQVALSVGSDSAESFTIRDELKFQAYRDHARQLQAAQLRGNQLQSQFAELQFELNQQARGAGQISESEVQQHPDVVLARKTLLNLNWQVEQMQKIAAGPDSPRLKSLVDKRDFVASETNQLEERVRSELRDRRLNSHRSEVQDKLAQLQQEIDLNRSETDYLRKQLSQIDTAAKSDTDGDGSADETAVPLDIARHAVERQSRLADGLWQTLQELRIESQSQPRVALLEWASLPRFASHSRQLRAASVAALSGCLLTVLLFGFAEWRDCWVRSPDDVTAHSQFPVFGVASWTAAHRETTSAGKRTRLSGGVREAGARILLRDHKGKNEAVSVLVTSCTSKEPHDVVALELAVLLSSLRRNVLLLDCDTGRSRLSHSLSATKLPGMRQLSGETGDMNPDTIAEFVVATEDPAVDLLPVGSMDDQHSWIDPATIRTVLDKLQPAYDAIVICGPPMMDSAESLLIAAEVNTSVIPAFVNRSRWSDLVLCEDSACQAGLPLSGTVLHTGKRLVNLRLQPDRDSRASQITPDPEQRAKALCEEIDELQKELRRTEADRESCGETEAKQLSQQPNKN